MSTFAFAVTVSIDTTPLLPPIAILVSEVERVQIDLMRRRSVELAVERGHLRRN